MMSKKSQKHILMIPMIYACFLCFNCTSPQNQHLDTSNSYQSTSSQQNPFYLQHKNKDDVYDTEKDSIINQRINSERSLNPIESSHSHYTLFGYIYNPTLSYELYNYHKHAYIPLYHKIQPSTIENPPIVLMNRANVSDNIDVLSEFIISSLSDTNNFTVERIIPYNPGKFGLDLSLCFKTSEDEIVNSKHLKTFIIILKSPAKSYMIFYFYTDKKQNVWYGNLNYLYPTNDQVYFTYQSVIYPLPEFIDLQYYKILRQDIQTQTEDLSVNASNISNYENIFEPVKCYNFPNCEHCMGCTLSNVIQKDCEGKNTQSNHFSFVFGENKNTLLKSDVVDSNFSENIYTTPHNDTIDDMNKMYGGEGYQETNDHNIRPLEVEAKDFSPSNNADVSIESNSEEKKHGSNNDTMFFKHKTNRKGPIKYKKILFSDPKLIADENIIPNPSIQNIKQENVYVNSMKSSLPFKCKESASFTTLKISNYPLNTSDEDKNKQTPELITKIESADSKMKKEINITEVNILEANENENESQRNTKFPKKYSDFLKLEDKSKSGNSNILNSKNRDYSININGKTSLLQDQLQNKEPQIANFLGNHISKLKINKYTQTIKEEEHVFIEKITTRLDHLPTKLKNPEKQKNKYEEVLIPLKQENLKTSNTSNKLNNPDKDAYELKSESEEKQMPLKEEKSMIQNISTVLHDKFQISNNQKKESQEELIPLEGEASKVKNISIVVHNKNKTLDTQPSDTKEEWILCKGKKKNKLPTHSFDSASIKSSSKNLAENKITADPHFIELNQDMDFPKEICFQSLEIFEGEEKFESMAEISSSVVINDPNIRNRHDSKKTGKKKIQNTNPCTIQNKNINLLKKKTEQSIVKNSIITKNKQLKSKTDENQGSKKPSSLVDRNPLDSQKNTHEFRSNQRGKVSNKKEKMESNKKKTNNEHAKQICKNKKLKIKCCESMQSILPINNILDKPLDKSLLFDMENISEDKSKTIKTDQNVDAKKCFNLIKKKAIALESENAEIKKEKTALFSGKGIGLIERKKNMIAAAHFNEYIYGKKDTEILQLPTVKNLFRLDIDFLKLFSSIPFEAKCSNEKHFDYHIFIQDMLTNNYQLHPIVEQHFNYVFCILAIRNTLLDCFKRDLLTKKIESIDIICEDYTFLKRKLWGKIFSDEKLFSDSKLKNIYIHEEREDKQLGEEFENQLKKCFGFVENYTTEYLGKLFEDQRFCVFPGGNFIFMFLLAKSKENKIMLKTGECITFYRGYEELFLKLTER